MITFELDQLIEKTEQRINAACAEVCDGVPAEKYAQLGNEVRAALESLKQEIIAIKN